MLSSIKDRAKNIHLAKVEIAFLIFLLLFGIPMTVLIPPGAGYDEEDHLVRVWELSVFSFIPGQMSAQEMKYPTLFRDFAYRQQGGTGILGSEFWQRYARAALDEYGFVRREINTKSVYPPPLLLPQALTMRLLARRADLPALPVFYACRLASLISYLLLVWLAIRLIPFGKWILLVMAVTPMALFQAATISPDAISNGIGFLFIAGSLKATEFKEIGWKEFLYFIFLIFLLFLAKLNLLPLILLLLLLVPPARFSEKRIYVSLLIATAILFLVEVAGWNLIASVQADPLLANEANLIAQLLYILGHPLVFIQTLIKDFLANGPIYVQGWINGYGYYYWTPPQIVTLCFLLSLATVLVSDSTFEPANRKFRIILILVFMAGYLATIVSLYLTFTPVGSDQVFGVQGRYFIPLALLVLLGVASLSWVRNFTLPSFKWTILFLAATLLLNTLGIFLSFYVPCGSTFYQTGLCYRPLSKGFSSEVHPSQPVANETSLVREMQVQCDGLAELRILILPSIPEDQGVTRFVLQDSINGETLLDTSITNTQISTEDWYPLRFEPDWHSAGKEYILTISSTNTTTRKGLRFLYTPQSDFDLGDFYENGVRMEEDLILQYGCATGLRKLWLAGIP
jgi:uncharacterized membrane protein